MEEEGLSRRYSNANFHRPLSFFRNVENLLRSPTTLCLNSFPFSLTFERVDPGAVQREYVGEGASCSGRPSAEAGAEAEAAGVVLPAPRQLRRGVTNCEKKILKEHKPVHSKQKKRKWADADPHLLRCESSRSSPLHASRLSLLRSGPERRFGQALHPGSLLPRPRRPPAPRIGARADTCPDIQKGG